MAALSSLVSLILLTGASAHFPLAFPFMSPFRFPLLPFRPGVIPGLQGLLSPSLVQGQLAQNIGQGTGSTAATLADIHQRIIELRELLSQGNLEPNIAVTLTNTPIPRAETIPFANAAGILASPISKHNSASGAHVNTNSAGAVYSAGSLNSASGTYPKTSTTSFNSATGVYPPYNTGPLNSGSGVYSTSKTASSNSANGGYISPDTTSTNAVSGIYNAVLDILNSGAGNNVGGQSGALDVYNGNSAGGQLGTVDIYNGNSAGGQSGIVDIYNGNSARGQSL